MGVLFSNQSKKEPPGRPADRHIGGPKFEPCVTITHECASRLPELWQPDEQQVQKLVEMGFAEAAVRSALEAAYGDEILAIKMLRFAEGAQAGNDTDTEQWQPDEQQVQKLVEKGFAEAAARSALEAVNGALKAVNGDEILAIKMLRFAERARAGNSTKTNV